MINFPKIIVERLKGTGGGDNYLVKKGESPFNPNIPPPQPPVGIGDTYVFSTVNNSQVTGSLPISIGLITTGNPNWTIMDTLTGELLANSFGVVTEGITIQSDTASPDIIDMVNIAQPGFPNRRYTLRGNVNIVAIGTFQSIPLPGETGSVVVHSYSNNIKQYMFSINNANLTVPSHLPRHITSTANMFAESNLFNQDIGNWDTSNVKDMSHMFVGASAFNRDISRWKVRSVTNMTHMFLNATAFNQDLSPWCVSAIPSQPSNFDIGASRWSKLRPRWGTCPADEEVEPPYVPPVEEEVDDETIIKDFDFAVMRYKWLQSGGRDLDTRTYITTPDRSNRKVGWARLKNDNSYLIWNEDNTGSGVESVLIDIGKLKLDYPSEPILNIKMDAFWYNQLGDGKINLEFVTFKGGSMAISGYDWVNQGGLPIQILTLPVNTLVTMADDIDGENLATLSYDTLLKKGTFTPRDGPSIPLPDDGGGEVTPPPVGGGGNGPGGSVIPSNPVYPTDTQGFTFSVQTYNNESGSAPFELNLSMVDVGWALYSGSTKILSSTLISPEVTASISGRSVSLSFHLGANATRTFTFVGVAEQAIFYVPNTNYVGQEFTINRFSSTIIHHSFNVGHANLIVPNTLPNYVTSTKSMFYRALRFNQDLSGWDVSRVTNMADMFRLAESFNQNIGMWNTGNVTDMNSMFNNAVTFNQDISPWNVGKVTDMDNMFNNASSFSQDLSYWCVTNVTSEPYNFKINANVFWDTLKPIWGTCPSQDGGGVLTPLTIEIDNRAYDDVQTFVVEVPRYQTYVIKINGDVQYADGAVSPGNGMDVDGSLRTLYFGVPPNAVSTFVVEGELAYIDISTNAYTQQATIFNVLNYSDTIYRYSFSVKGSLLTVPQELSPVITSTYEMFSECTNFNQDISMWDVSNVTNMYGMFNGATNFNQNLSGWNVIHIPTEPTNFSFFTPAWVLPKPNWGGVVIEPPVQSAFVFDVDTREQDGERTFTVIVPSGEACEIYRDGEIAYSTIFEDPLVSSSVRWPNNTITITVPVGLMQTFRVIATPTLSKLELSVNSYSPALAAINVTSFSTDIVKYEFHTYNWNLSVQAPLPEHVTTTYLMFSQCHKFNSDISGWDMSNVVNAGYMFSACSIFNQNLANWNVANITNMAGMFYGTSVFNQDLSTWNVVHIPTEPADFATGSVEWTLPKPSWGGPTTAGFKFTVTGEPDISTMYISLDSPQPNWTLSQNGVVIGGGAQGNGNYVQFANTGSRVNDYVLVGGDFVVVLGLASWNSQVDRVDVTEFPPVAVTVRFKMEGTDLSVPTVLPSNITSLGSMFEGCAKFNQDISMWDTSNVTEMYGVFFGCVAFNQNINAWDVSSVGDTYDMFNGCSSYNQPMNRWDVSSVYDMHAMFSDATSFNQDISSWNVENVTNMSNMFANARLFNQDLYPWNVVKIPSEPNGFSYSTSSWELPKPLWADGNWVSTGYTQTDATVTIFAAKRTTLGLFTTSIICPPVVEEITQEVMIGNLNEQVDAAVKQMVGSSTVIWELDTVNQQITYLPSN